MVDESDRIYRSLLVLRCQAGDHAAFEEVVGLYQFGLRYFLQKMVGENQGADDLLQDVWLDVFRGVSKLIDPATFPTWLYQIARHRALHTLHKQRQPVQSLEGIDPPDKSEAKLHFRAEEAEQVHAALGQLKADQREVLLLRF